MVTTGKAASSVAPAAKKPAAKAVAKRVTKQPAPKARPVVSVVAKPLPKAVIKPALVEVKVAGPVEVVKPVKDKKPKLVRDSFTIPKSEYNVLDVLKLRAAKLGSPAKKSELLRAGIKALAAMADGAYLTALKAVPAVKTGRPAAK